MSFIIKHRSKPFFLITDAIGKPITSSDFNQALTFETEQDAIKVFQQISLLYRFFYEIVDTIEV